MFRIFFIVIILSFFIFSLFSNSKSLYERDLVVVKVLDGDTIRLSDGKEIRLLGIDAPEKGEYYYYEAKNFLENLVLGKRVILEKDVTDKDKYGRYLRYIYVNNTLVNLELVEKGYAKVIVRIPDIKYLDSLMRAENYARKNRLGIWEKQ